MTKHKTFYNDNNFRIIEEQNQVCNECDDIKIYHPINLCYNYKPKFNQVKKEIPIENNWSNYFKGFFTTIEPTVEITYEPVYSKNYVKPFDLGKAYSGPYLTSTIGGVTNFPFIDTGCCNTPPTPPRTPTLPTVNWLSLYLDKLEYIMNGMWIDMSKYMTNNVYKFLTPVKYITENDIVQLNIQIKNQTYEIEQMKNTIENTIENMKTQMLSYLKHKINHEFVKLDKSDNNYKVLINKFKDKLEIFSYKLLDNQRNINELFKNYHKQKTKLLMYDIEYFYKSRKHEMHKDTDSYITGSGILIPSYSNFYLFKNDHKQESKELMQDIKSFNKEKLNKAKDMLDDTFLNIEHVDVIDYEKINV